MINGVTELDQTHTDAMECGVKSYRSEYFLNTHTPLSLLSMECGVKSLHRLEYFLNTHTPLSLLFLFEIKYVKEKVTSLKQSTSLFS